MIQTAKVFLPQYAYYINNILYIDVILVQLTKTPYSISTFNVIFVVNMVII